VCGTSLLTEFRLCDIWLVDSKRFLPWRQLNGSWRPEGRWYAFNGRNRPNSNRRNPLTKHACNIGNRSETSLSEIPVCFRQSRNVRNRLGRSATIRIHRKTTLACLRHNVIQFTTTKLSKAKTISAYDQTL